MDLILLQFGSDDFKKPVLDLRGGRQRITH
jgi:hypothetical protein